MKRILSSLAWAAISAATLCLLPGCNQKSEPAIVHDQVKQATLHDVRLGDGVPLDLEVAIRWTIDDAPTFRSQFQSARRFDSLVLIPKSLEIANQVANQYESVDSVFSPQRKQFIDDIKLALAKGLKDGIIHIREIIVSNIIYPKSYTNAQEQVAMKERELELIRKQNVVEVEAAKAAKIQAAAEGEVNITRAKMEGELAQINAETESNRRRNELARAQTAAQVDQLRAEAEAKRLKMIADAELEKKTDLEKLAVAKERELKEVEFEQTLKLAKLTNENPTYAAFLVNKELASKVEIAVLPSGMDGNLFGDFLKTGMKR